MARAMWTGTVGFGLVQIPVSVYPAKEHDELDLTMLDRRDFSPIGYHRVNKRTGKEVAWENIVKGYEAGKGKYVVLTDADFEAANVEATRQIDILAFVGTEEIDPRYLDRPYYLAPQKAGKKAYALLRETLRRTGKVGIGKVVLRSRQHLCAIIGHEKTLLLQLLRFADELRKESELDLPETNLAKLGVTPKELKMAEQLVAGMVEKFQPEKYEDDYRRDLMKLVRKRIKAGEVNQVPEADAETKRPRETGAKIIDLSALLAETLASGKGGRSHGKANGKRSAKTTAKSKARSEHRTARSGTHRKSA